MSSWVGYYTHLYTIHFFESQPFLDILSHPQLAAEALIAIQCHRYEIRTRLLAVLRDEGVLG